MPRTEPFGYVSIIGLSLLRSVVPLIETLEAAEAAPPNQVQTGGDENGLSAAVILLVITSMESAINRMRYVRKDAIPGKKEHVIDYFRRIVPASQENTQLLNTLVDDLEECFAVRDAIAHSHLWQASIYWDDTDLWFDGNPELLQGFGDQRLRRVMDPNTRKSNRLSLNLFPSRIWRRDAWVALRVADRLFTALEAMDINYFYISPQSFTYRGKQVYFRDLVAGLLDVDEPSVGTTPSIGSAVS